VIFDVFTLNTGRRWLVPSALRTLGLFTAIKLESVVANDRTFGFLLIIISTSDTCILDISEAPVTAIVTDDIGWIDAFGNLAIERAIDTLKGAGALDDFAAETHENARTPVQNFFITSDHATWESGGLWLHTTLFLG
jgi:hypothetical protein